jgi:predicted RNase H-like HicB family nuclease
MFGIRTRVIISEFGKISDKQLYPKNWRGIEKKAEDRYLKFTRWEEEDNIYVGYCPDLFPWGGVCHGATEEEAFTKLCILVCEEVADLIQYGKQLPPSSTRAMRDAIPA